MSKAPRAVLPLAPAVAVAIAAACGAGGGGSGPGPAPGPSAEGRQGAGSPRFDRVIDPFPVFGVREGPLAHPFLGGFDVPRPQLVDIDGDGDLDLFVQERTGQLVFLENVGTRGAPEYEWRSDRWRGIDVGEWSRFTDLDGDGDLDLLAERPYSYVAYFRNDGSTASPDLRPVGDSVRNTAGEPIFSDRQNIPNVADIDCDGAPDLFLGRADGTVARYELEGFEQDGTPTFELRAERFEDIEIVAQIGGRPAGDAPDPDPSPPPARRPPSARHGANSMGLADWDGDGDIDFLWGDFFEPSVLLIENSGSCGRPDLRNEPRPLRTAPGDSLLTSGYNVPAPADVDADGDLDLVVGILGGAFNPNRTAASSLVLWRRTGGGALVGAGPLLEQVDVGSESVPGVGDVDGDGDLDLLVANRIGPGPDDGSLVFLFENRGRSDAPALHLVDTLRLGDNYHYAPLPWDADGDGDLDLAVGTWNDDVLLYRNEGRAPEGGVAPRWVRADSPLVVLTRGSNATPALGDVDGDGLEDLVVGESSGDLNLYRNTGERRADGAPRFELVTDELHDAGRRSHPALFDWDGDGDLDLVVGREAPGAALLLNDGTGAFREAGTVLPDLPPFAAPRFSDLDGDGDADVVSGGLGGGLVWLESRGISGGGG